MGGPAERLGELVRGGVAERAAGLPAVQRRGAGLGVDLAVVLRFDPGLELAVEVVQAGHGAGGPGGGGLVGDLDEELAPHRCEETFDLAASFGPVRGGVRQPDPELRAGAQQPGVGERRAVVDVDLGGDAAGGERGA